MHSLKVSGVVFGTGKSELQLDQHMRLGWSRMCSFFIYKMITGFSSSFWCWNVCTHKVLSHRFLCLLCWFSQHCLKSVFRELCWAFLEGEAFNSSLLQCFWSLWNCIEIDSAEQRHTCERSRQWRCGVSVPALRTQAHRRMLFSSAFLKMCI